jgi:hypothetical protein
MKTTIADSILPMKIKDLVEMICNRKGLSVENAIYYLYFSKLYSDLHNDNLKLWYQSSEALYDLLENEKCRVNYSQGLNEKETLFCVFCIENYIKNKRPNQKAEVLEEFSEMGVYSFLLNNFEMLHSQDVNIIVDSIEEYIRSRR